LVTVLDGGNLEVDCPSDITVVTNDPDGAVVDFDVPNSGTCLPPQNTYSPLGPGDRFPVGVTDVLVTLSADFGDGAECRFKVTVLLDSDGDGTLDSIESGDGNSDGIPDREQANVVTVVSPVDASTITLEVPTTATLSSVSISDPAAPPPAGVVLPHGLLEFTIHVPTGASVEMLVYLPEDSPATTWFKSDPWWEFLFDGTTGAVAEAPGLVLHFTDGGRGDADASANGTIVDPGGPAADNRLEDQWLVY
jgi:hypothetical protein